MSSAIVVRLVTFALVAWTAFLWPRDMRRRWHEFDARAKRVTVAIMPVFASNALGLLNAAYSGRPLTWATYLLAMSYAVLVAVLLYSPRDER